MLNVCRCPRSHAGSGFLHWHYPSMKCLDLPVSDHFTVCFPVPVSRLHTKHIIAYRNQKQGSVFSTLALNNVIEIHFASDPPNTMINMLVDYYNAAISSILYSLSHPQNLDCLFYLPCPMVYYVSPWPKVEWPPTLEALHKNHKVYKYHVRPHKEALSQAKASYYSSLVHQQQLQLQLTLATSVSSSSSTFLQPSTLFFTPSFSPA